MRKNTRVYPVACRSAYCGKTECPKDCQFLPALTNFKEWVKNYDAVVEDEIWCPTVYTARRTSDYCDNR